MIHLPSLLIGALIGCIIAYVVVLIATHYAFKNKQ